MPLQKPCKTDSLANSLGENQSLHGRLLRPARAAQRDAPIGRDDRAMAEVPMNRQNHHKRGRSTFFAGSAVFPAGVLRKIAQPL